MSLQAVLLPLFVQVALTFGLLFWMGGARVTSIRSGEVKMRDVALRQPNWTPHVLKIGNAYHNQLELPLLFYVLTILALFTRQTDLLFVLLAWVFVATRLLHAYIFVTSNNVGRRFYAFLAGAIVLLAMWIVFALRILLAI